MATQVIPISFICAGETDFDMLDFKHSIPSSLITATPAPGHAELLAATLEPVIKEHEAACYAACTKNCVVCGDTTTRVKMIPSSHLRRVEAPQVSIFTSTVCEKSGCDRKAQQDFVEFMEKIGKDEADAGNDIETRVAGACKVCGKTEKTQRCSQFKVTIYCGSEHQKKDWKVHKKICKPAPKSSLP